MPAICPLSSPRSDDLGESLILISARKSEIFSLVARSRSWRLCRVTDAHTARFDDGDAAGECAEIGGLHKVCDEPVDPQRAERAGETE